MRSSGPWPYRRRPQAMHPLERGSAHSGEAISGGSSAGGDGEEGLPPAPAMASGAVPAAAAAVAAFSLMRLGNYWREG